MWTNSLLSFVEVCAGNPTEWYHYLCGNDRSHRKWGLMKVSPTENTVVASCSCCGILTSSMPPNQRSMSVVMLGFPPEVIREVVG
jgi:hypothetical protein